jgi:selenocysteine-specific elongation factor
MLIATAGHVDHGKTLLVHALTGVDTDRLPEEKQRGLTIDLGFAYQTTDDGQVLGFVDVPGHERFIRNMIAGVPAIDFALLVVAADDGPMPQTLEHLAILDLLGVDHGAVVVSKCDRVEPARVEAVCEAVREVTAGSSLAGMPVFPLSAMTGEGMDALREHLAKEAAARQERHASGCMRFAVDRSFSVKGAGLVVTGAVYAGSIAAGDRLLLAGTDLEVRVRGIESAGASVENASAGMRCALNLAGRGVDARSVSRGHWLVSTDAGPVSDRFDVQLKLLGSESAPLKQWTPVHVHHGASFITGRVTLPGGEPIQPGEEGVAQIVTGRPVSAVYGERLVLRDTSGRRTLGGARIIDPYAPRRARDRQARLQLLEILREPDHGDALRGALQASPDGVDVERFAQGRNQTLTTIMECATSLGAVSIDTADGRRLVLPETFDALRAAVRSALTTWHETQPEAVGPRELELLGQLARGPSQGLAAAALSTLVRAGEVVRDGISLRLPGHQPSLSPVDAALWDRVSVHLTPEATKPPTVGDLATTLELDRVMLLDFLERSARRGQLIRVAANRFFHPRAVATLAQSAESLGHGEPGVGFDARRYRDATGIGRNLTIDVLEFFDVMGLTRRVGDTRKVIRTSSELFGNL